MKKYLTLPMLCLLLYLVSPAQHARLHISLAHSTLNNVELVIFSRTLNQNFFKKELKEIGLGGYPQFLTHPVAADLHPPYGNAHQPGYFLTGQVHPKIGTE